MKPVLSAAFLTLLLFGLFTSPAPAQTNLPFWSLAPTPPMGWNSWDCFGTTVRENQVKLNALYMAQHLAPYGWQYVTVDIQWYEPNGTGFNYPSNPQSNIDAYGRLWPVTNKHPSAVNGLGFKPLADYIHGLGLKFGIHLMRGIPRRAWTQNTPVLGTAYTARDIANTNSTCSWNPDMYGVDMTKPGAQEYYNSVFALIAGWDVDFVKVDDLSQPYHLAEIEGIRNALDNCGRPIVLSTSPGATPLSRGAHVMQHANQWRISDDFWDNWTALYEQFQRLHNWTPYRGAGFWPDADMLPLGNVRALQSSGNWTGFTTNEQRTMMSLWSIARSPLIMGGNLTNNDAFTLSLLTNAEVIAVNQHSANSRQLFRNNNKIAWTADVPGSAARYLALINGNETGFDETEAAFDSGVISRSTPGRSVQINANIAGAQTLYLVVDDGGDYFGWDHADWGQAHLMRENGTSNLITNLSWDSATAGYGSARYNLSTDGNALKINGVTQAYGIGTHAISVIKYTLPEPYTAFRALAGLDDEILSTAPSSSTNATIRFLVFTNEPTGTRIQVTLKSLGLEGPVVVRDLWAQQDIGTFTNSFSQLIEPHASGLFKLTPVSALPTAGRPQNLRASVTNNSASLEWDAVPSVTGYNVFRTTPDGGPLVTVARNIASTGFTNTGLANGTWIYSVTALSAAGESEPSAEASAYVPFDWTSHDIGSVQQSGTTFLGDGSFQISAAGSDIWDTSDAFRFAFMSLSGDVTVTARVRQQSGNDSWEKAGVMIRESTNASARHCFMLVSPSAISFQRREQTGGGSYSSANVNDGSTPRWLRLVRRGNEFSAFYSDNGADWTQLDSTVTISMDENVLAGLAVTAHSSSTLGTAFFDDVSIRNAAPPTTPSMVSVTALSESQAKLTWIDNATNETAYLVERSTNGTWHAIATGLSANTTEFTNSALVPGITASYRVRAEALGVYSEAPNATGLVMPAGVGDGIPGWWRLEHFGDGLSDAGDAALHADPDHDGADNLAEYLADTDPNDASSVLQIHAALNPESRLTLSFLARTNRRYRIESAASLSQPDWGVEIDSLQGEGLLQLTNIEPAAQQRCFRVQAME